MQKMFSAGLNGCTRSAGFLMLAFFSTGLIAQEPFERTEQREPCDQYHVNKRPMFGDLHVHTSYSFDSYVSSQRNDPDAAYRYARGEPITLPDADANQTVIASRRRGFGNTTI